MLYTWNMLYVNYTSVKKKNLTITALKLHQPNEEDVIEYGIHWDTVELSSPRIRNSQNLVTWWSLSKLHGDYVVPLTRLTISHSTAVHKVVIGCLVWMVGDDLASRSFPGSLSCVLHILPRFDITLTFGWFQFNIEIHNLRESQKPNLLRSLGYVTD